MRELHATLAHTAEMVGGWMNPTAAELELHAALLAATAQLDRLFPQPGSYGPAGMVRDHYRVNVFTLHDGDQLDVMAFTEGDARVSARLRWDTAHPDDLHPCMSVVDSPTLRGGC